MAKKYPGDVLMSQHCSLLEFDNENGAVINSSLNERQNPSFYRNLFILKKRDHQ